MNDHICTIISSIVVLLLPLSIHGQAVDDCSIGHFGFYGVNNTCVWNCDTGSSVISIESLSFLEIERKCSNIAASPCTNLNELIWTTDICQCPYCKCSPENTQGSIIMHESYFRKSCYNCTCTQPQSDPNIIDLVYQCDTLFTTNKASGWQIFTCPPNSCDDGIGSLGQGYWADVNSNEACNKYCYCYGDGTTVCETGYQSILNSQYTELVHAFMDICFQYIQDCSDDTSRMFTDSVGVSCPSSLSTCPRCDCGSYTLDQEWETQFIDPQNNDITLCNNCQCSSYTNNIYWVECDSHGEHVCVDSTEAPASVIQCHAQNYDISTTVGTLNSMECPATDEWCGWDKSGWGCQSLYCDAFGVKDECISYDINITYNICGAADRIYQESNYYYCCNTNNCNHKDMNINSCTQSTQLQKLKQDWYTCLYEDKTNGLFGYGDGSAVQCDSKSTTVTCDGAKSFVLQYMLCQCEYYGGFYANVNNAWKTWLQNSMNDFFEMFDFDKNGWNDALGCDIHLYCDLENGGIIVNYTITNSDAPTAAPIIISSSPTTSQDVIIGTPTRGGQDDGNSAFCNVPSGIICFLIVYCAVF